MNCVFDRAFQFFYQITVLPKVQSMYIIQIGSRYCTYKLEIQREFYFYFRAYPTKFAIKLILKILPSSVYFTFLYGKHDICLVLKICHPKAPQRPKTMQFMLNIILFSSNTETNDLIRNGFTSVCIRKSYHYRLAWFTHP